ncbi:hypothetical protein [Paenibacillus aceti]|uniref:Methyltransferase n=1 Tax=Paenibacillus aceti TaxID=1820010 RepID=A0ABQ1VTR3_9BACL|nr:hypothetical protein [Paenibacillus aceti]GGF94194.1 hypothetical protein GCM10010913_14640 [Paenibacillus aceti]
MGSFDRKVERNQKRLNQKGKGPTITTGKAADPRKSLGPRGDGDIFRGRNIIFPGVLVLVALLYSAVGFIGRAAEMNSWLYWMTIGLYLLLAFTLFMRRPYLRINKNWIYTTKYNRDRILEAGNISKIKVSRKKIMIVPKIKDANWVFYRHRNLFDVAAMGDRLEQFANAYHVPFERE